MFRIAILVVFQYEFVEISDEFRMLLNESIAWVQKEVPRCLAMLFGRVAAVCALSSSRSSTVKLLEAE